MPTWTTVRGWDAKKAPRTEGVVAQGWLYATTGKGSHTVWLHPSLDATIVLSGNDGDDAKPYQQRDVELALRKLEDRNA